MYQYSTIRWGIKLILLDPLHISLGIYEFVLWKEQILIKHVSYEVHFNMPFKSEIMYIMNT